MKILKKPNTGSNWICPICKTAEIREVVLIEIDGHFKNKNREIEQVHLCCLDLKIERNFLGENDLIYQHIEE